jgi:glycosyltransferase involved in cell wall biosynthesis
MTVSIVIRAFNEGKHIAHLLEAIMQQTADDIETILVDSGSTDDTVDTASQFPVKIMSIQPDEFTFGRSLNRGIQAASGEIIVITSAHCYPVYSDWIARLTEPFVDSSVAAAYGKQRGGDTNHYSEHMFFRKYFPDTSQPHQSHPYSHNANAAVRRTLWETHPYNENLTGLEDLAWSSWAMEEGYSIAYVAEAEIVHLHDENMAQVYNRFLREAIAMKQILPNSSFTFRHFITHWMRNSWEDMLAAERDNVLGEQLLDIIVFRFMQYWGTFRGYSYSGKIDTRLHRKFYYPPGILSVRTPAGREIKPIEYEK